MSFGFCLKQQEQILAAAAGSSKHKDVTPVGNYRDKYRHLIGDDVVTKDDAKETVANRSYGFGMLFVFELFSYVFHSVYYFFFFFLFLCLWIDDSADSLIHLTFYLYKKFFYQHLKFLVSNFDRAVFQEPGLNKSELFFKIGQNSDVVNSRF